MGGSINLTGFFPGEFELCFDEEIEPEIDANGRSGREGGNDGARTGCGLVTDVEFVRNDDDDARGDDTNADERESNGEEYPDIAVVANKKKSVRTSAKEIGNSLRSDSPIGSNQTRRQTVRGMRGCKGVCRVDSRNRTVYLENRERASGLQGQPHLRWGLNMNKNVLWGRKCGLYVKSVRMKSRWGRLARHGLSVGDTVAVLRYPSSSCTDHF